MQTEYVPYYDPYEGLVASGFVVFIALLLAWLVLALVTVNIAGSKRLSRNGWGILGLIFGPFALLAVLLVKPDRSPQSRPEE
ncbi:MAG: hypothetical protein OXC19_24355 [Bryobacterales bacterium]|nr:hypothetical protein [Bryobacterales bacterium]